MKSAGPQTAARRANWEAVIGLEVHAQLLTQSKLFCGCPVAFGAPPNSQVCPVCLGHPGVLPVLNRRAVELAVRAGLATDCEVRLVSIFARKNYFYPDLPKNYQISQYEEPICESGHLEIAIDGELRRIRIRRIHLEEDAGKSKHPETAEASESLIDLNRTGTGLVEIVSEPDLRSAAEAHAYLAALRQLLQHLEVCDGNMEEGSLRCDANVSVRPRGETALGTRTELKNLNSFRFVERAIELEIDRQIERLEAGGSIEQETLLYDPSRHATRTMRSKEDAHDYRYFAEPDLPPLVLSSAWIEEIRRDLPELPRAKALRFQTAYALAPKEAAVLAASRPLAEYFEAVLATRRTSAAAAPVDPKVAANWLLSELLGQLNKRELEIERSPVEAARFAGLVRQIGAGALSSKLGKMALEEMCEGSATVEELMERHGWKVVADPSLLQSLVDAVIAEFPDSVAQYRAGKDSAFRFFVGQVMKRTQGQADPNLLQRLLEQALGPPGTG